VMQAPTVVYNRAGNAAGAIKYSRPAQFADRKKCQACPQSVLSGMRPVYTYRGVPPPPCYAHEYQNKGVRSVDLGMNIKTKDLGRNLAMNIRTKDL
jgi:hypothetical protein